MDYFAKVEKSLRTRSKLKSPQKIKQMDYIAKTKKSQD